MNLVDCCLSLLLFFLEEGKQNMGEKELLMGTKDVFGGLIIDLEKEEQKEVLQLSPEAFSQLLQVCKKKKKRKEKKSGR